MPRMGSRPTPRPEVRSRTHEFTSRAVSGSEEARDHADPDPHESAEGSDQPWPEGAGPSDAPMDPSVPGFETSDDPRIPHRQSSFRIGEVAQIVGVKPYVIRFWESEFSAIRPQKTETGQRRYLRSDVALLLRVKRLRHDAQLTLAQTRSMVEEGRPETAPLLPSMADGERARLRRQIGDLRREVLDLLAWVDE
ncbi:MAG: MerR family transcriptional regulator [Myxococcota bacterium]